MVFDRRGGLPPRGAGDGDGYAGGRWVCGEVSAGVVWNFAKAE